MALNKRQVFIDLYKKYLRIGKDGIRLSESSLVLIQPISATKSSYNFPVLENDSIAPLVDEIRLNLNDEFTGVSLGIYIGGYTYNTTDTTGASAFKLWSYAPLELDGRAISVQPLYDGKFSFSVNKITYLEKWRTNKHEFIPQTQFATNPVPVAGPPVISNSFPATIPQIDRSRNGLVDLNATITLSGAKKNGVDIELPSALTAITVTYLDQQGTINYVHLSHIVVVIDGFLGQNASKFQGS